MVSRKITTRPLSEKVLIIDDVESGLKQADVARKYGIPASTISNIWLNRHQIRTNYADGHTKKKPVLMYEELDKLVLAWFTDMRSQNVPMSGPMLIEQALYYAKQLNLDFKGSNGWIDKFKKRYVVFKNNC